MSTKDRQVPFFSAKNELFRKELTLLVNLYAEGDSVELAACLGEAFVHMIAREGVSAKDACEFLCDKLEETEQVTDSTFAGPDIKKSHLRLVK